MNEDVWWCYTNVCTAMIAVCDGLIVLNSLPQAPHKQADNDGNMQAQLKVRKLKTSYSTIFDVKCPLGALTGSDHRCSCDPIQGKSTH
jgi:hypothetical protein